MNILGYLALAAAVSLAIKWLTHRIGMPIVTGYVLVGIFLGISLIGVFHAEILDRMDIINDFALGIIGFTIGAELRREVFQKLGKSILVIALLESALTFVVVSVSISVLMPSKIYLAFILGAVASATAPAATVHVIQQYKAKGPLTSTILAVVGIDDAFALMIYVFVSAVVKGMLKSQNVPLFHTLMMPALEICLSIIVGTAVGIAFVYIFRKIRYSDDLLLGTAAALLALMAVSRTYNLSGLLAAMAFGTVVSNLNVNLIRRSAKVLENVSPLIFAFFFIFAGAHLDVGLFPVIGLTGLVYLLSRMTGKIAGASLGALIGKALPQVRKYIGFSLIPQVGVALALAIMVQHEFAGGEYGETGERIAVVVINVLLFTTVITEIVGPLLTKWALSKAKERQA
jgi:Kef-type K+ transport system membrane component KefB